MRKILLCTLLSLTLALALPAFSKTTNGRDIIVTMNDITMQAPAANSKDIHITLKNPKINYKVEFGQHGPAALTLQRFASLWSNKAAIRNANSFVQDAPNATLSFWEQGKFYETDFAIKNVEQTADELIMTVNMIGGDKIPQQITGQKNSIVMLIDRSPFDPRHH